MGLENEGVGGKESNGETVTSFAKVLEKFSHRGCAASVAGGRVATRWPGGRPGGTDL